MPERGFFMTSNTRKSGSGGKNNRTARLEAELRANLQRRKAQARSRRTGEADERPDGLGGTQLESPDNSTARQDRNESHPVSTDD